MIKKKEYNMQTVSIRPIHTPISFTSKRNEPRITLYDVFVNEGIIPPKKGLEEIRDIRAGELGGTVCRGSIPMQNFVRVIPRDELKLVLQKGLSTNTDGVPHSFLKSKMDNPLSTSCVHDCSVMYLYNKKANTHFLYHADSDCTRRTLKFMIEEMMPEGIDGAAIIPGESYWHNRHENNMRNMFDLIKKNNPKAVVNVYHDSTQYPEIVGYKGKVFEIPNMKVLNQIKYNMRISDYGQASFKISNIEGANTFDRIKYHCNSPEELKEVVREFKSQKFDPEILKILNSHLHQKEVSINQIFACKTIQELNRVEFIVNSLSENSLYEAIKKMKYILKHKR